MEIKRKFKKKKVIKVLKGFMIWIAIISTKKYLIKIKTKE